MARPTVTRRSGRLAQELLATEKVYREKLESLVHHWEKPLQRWCEEQTVLLGAASAAATAAGTAPAAPSTPRRRTSRTISLSRSDDNGSDDGSGGPSLLPPITRAEIDLIFLNVDDLAALHASLLDRLVEASFKLELDGDRWWRWWWWWRWRWQWW